MSALAHDPEPFGQDDACDVDPLPADAGLRAADQRSRFVDLTARLANDLAAFGRWVADHPDLPVPYQRVCTVVTRFGDPMVRFTIHVTNWPHDTADELSRLADLLRADGEPVTCHVGDTDQTYERRFGLVALDVWATLANLRRAA